MRARSAMAGLPPAGTRRDRLVTAVMEPGERYTTAQVAELAGMPHRKAEYALRMAFGLGRIERTSLQVANGRLTRYWLRR